MDPWLGLLTTVHASPSHRSVRVSTTEAETSASPTAHTSDPLSPPIPSNRLSFVPTLGVRTGVHFAPSQFSARVRRGRDVLSNQPVAQTSSDDAPQTPKRSD